MIEAPAHVRCSHCSRNLAGSEALFVEGSPRLGYGEGGQVFEMRQTRYACSEACRSRISLWPETPKPEADPVVDAFRAASYERGTWKNNQWLGVPILKNPTDLFVYQEILHEVRPDVVIECGTFYGGSALYLATVMDALGKGRVYSIDTQEMRGRPEHPRITYLSGSSVHPDVVNIVRGNAEGKRTLVILDSDHSAAHVREEIETYAPLVSLGSYLIVEDTNVDGTPPEDGGPAVAVESFMRDNDEFAVDYGREKFLFSYNPGGYLKRVAGGAP